MINSKKILMVMVICGASFSLGACDSLNEWADSKYESYTKDDLTLEKVEMQLENEWDSRKDAHESIQNINGIWRVLTYITSGIYGNDYTDKEKEMIYVKAIEWFDNHKEEISTNQENGKVSYMELEEIERFLTLEYDNKYGDGLSYEEEKNYITFRTGYLIDKERRFMDESFSILKREGVIE